MQTQLAPQFQFTAQGLLGESILRKCVHCGFDENLTLDRMMIDCVFVLCLLYGTFKLLIEQKQLMDEVTKLKEEIQIKSSEKQQVKAQEQSSDTRKPQLSKEW